MGGGDGTYANYEETTVDPGFAFIVAVVVVSMAMNACLPCLVSLGSRYERRRKQPAAQAKTDEEQVAPATAAAAETSKVVIVDLRRSLSHNQPPNRAIGPQDDVSRGHGSVATPNPAIEVLSDQTSHTYSHTKRNQLHQDTASLVSGTPTAFSGAKEMLTKVVDSVIMPSYPVSEARSVATSSMQSVTSSSIIDSVFSGGRPKRRRAQYSHKLRTERRHAAAEHRPLDTYSVKESVMSRLNPDDVSFTEAVDYYAPGHYMLPKENDVTKVDLVYGDHAWYRPRMLNAAFDRVVGIAEWDLETKKIVKLAIPYSLQAIMYGVFSTIDIAIVGHFFGIAEANAIIIVELLFSLSQTLTYGFTEALGSLIPHAIGAENERKAGNLITETAFWYVILSIPGLVLWYNVTEDAILYFGFDEETAAIGQKYVYIMAMDSILGGIDGIIYQVLDVTEHTTYTTAMTFIGGIVELIMVLGLVYIGIDDIIFVAYCEFALTGAFMLINIGVMVYTGWMSKFTEGIFSPPFTDWEQTKLIVKTAIPLGIAYILTYGEWEVMTVFASMLGPAEVATWGLMGYIWSVLEYISAGVADASEVRCGIHLGANCPEKARLCAYKCLFIGLLTSLVATSILFIVAENAVELITPDETVQRLMLEIIPLLGMGQISMTTGVMAWAIIGAQGRYRLATTVQFITSWGVTIPLSAVFTYVMNFNLQGLLGAMTLGYTLSGVTNTYILIRTHWTIVARTISDRNATEEDEAVEQASEASHSRHGPSAVSGSTGRRHAMVPAPLLAGPTSTGSSDDDEDE